jgi:hypothetical protein
VKSSNGASLRTVESFPFLPPPRTRIRQRTAAWCGGFLTNAPGGNTFSGITDAVTGGLSVADLAFSGTHLGLPGSSPLQKGIAGVVTDAAVGGAWSSVTGAGQTIQTLNGAASLASTGIEAGEFATGVGEARLAYDFLSYGAGLLTCSGR